MFTNSKLFSYEEGIALSGDLEIYYRDYGPKDGEPILLVQGLSLIHISEPTRQL